MDNPIYTHVTLDAVTAFAALAHAGQFDAEEVAKREKDFVDMVNGNDDLDFEEIHRIALSRACKTCEAFEPQDFGHLYAHADTED